ncbi:MAG: S16 family serine protease, partial [Chloroflexota bacterium]
EQNTEFVDHFLDVPYNLSQVLFITTANDLYPLPPALEDRLEIIEFPVYIEEEKRAIAQQYLIPRQLEAHGLQANKIRLEDRTLQTIIQEYTYEAGVRGLDRRIAEILRKIARRAAEGKKHPQRITPKLLAKLLGPPDYTTMRANDEDSIGVATGLAWTEAGGDVMTIEVSLLPGKGNLTLTGQLGEIMQESAQTALSYMRGRADEFEVPHDDFDNFDLHIHLPEGAVPKDGPSAGVTLAIALISVFTERKIRSDVAMTGEVTLRGKILPVGGIREKVMAARRAGINTVILPELNQPDLQEIPAQARKAMNIIAVSNMQEVIDNALLPAPDERERDMRQQYDEEETESD